ncbi:hypothetical protein QFZ26_003519 [Agromyces ramosus]|uniref:Uncharacterized protein n=1 Tax=Agromyces ramosus TaxID=33879 RepID=A0ABU0RD12_9MICO|nr:hypothetical protein [Agromyces ramosus]
MLELFALRGRLTSSGFAALAPCANLIARVPSGRHDGRPAEQLAACLDHAPVEVLDGLAHLGFAVHSIQLGLELGVLDPQGERRRAQSAQLLALDLATNPPVGVVLPSQSIEGLSRARQVVEFAATDGLLDRVLHVCRPLSLRGRSSRFGRRIGVIGLFATRDGLFTGEAIEPVLPRGALRILAQPRPPSRYRISIFHDTTPRLRVLVAGAPADPSAGD